MRLYYSAAAQIRARPGNRLSGADGALILTASGLPSELTLKFKYVQTGMSLKVADSDLKKIPELLRQQLVLVQEDSRGNILNATQLQNPGALDDIYMAALKVDDLGVAIAQTHPNNPPQTGFKLWAPTAQNVAVCVYPQGRGTASKLLALQRSDDTGIWSARDSADLSAQYYQYLVDVHVPGAGIIRNRVTDPYSLSLTTDSRRSYITALDATVNKPIGWDDEPPRLSVKSPTDMTVYELHVRDFSINDASVSPAHRGKYMAFTEFSSNGMQHLAALAKAGMTDIHLLPVFDFASVPEQHCRTPIIAAAWRGDSLQQQAAVTALADRDCFNWGYDPYHFSAPEGSYSTDAGNGAARIIELRRMVQALHSLGLRVGMDVVYNHTFASGQQEQSVLDRIVPGYYHRLNADGVVEHSSCCENTATEHAMMGKLLTDSVLSWAQQYHIDSFRFDLMAHQPRAVMEALQTQLQTKTGHAIQLLGEGWNFGEVENGKRFVQASQLSLNGTGIGTFNDRLRDAVRGGSPSDSGNDLIQRKGYLNGLSGLEQMQAADLVRVGLAGSLRDFAFVNYDGIRRKSKDIDYHGQPAGYVSAPAEVVNYLENHDNQTLFDINAYKLPLTTSREDRARIQMLGAAIVAFSQGVAYYHAGIDLLRSKSLDSNSFNSGDWFNRLDWSYQDNYFASGMPPAKDNSKNYGLIKPLLNTALIKPTASEIKFSRDMLRDLLRIRSSSSLFHMSSASEIEQRLTFENIGPDQQAQLLVGQLDGEHYPGANYRSILYMINVANQAQTIVLANQKNKQYVLHPVQSNAAATDQRLPQQVRYDPINGQFTLPALSAVVFVEP